VAQSSSSPPLKNRLSELEIAFFELDFFEPDRDVESELEL
jgi:hypothetical protein